MKQKVETLVMEYNNLNYYFYYITEAYKPKEREMVNMKESILFEE